MCSRQRGGLPSYSRNRLLIAIGGILVLFAGLFYLYTLQERSSYEYTPQPGTVPFGGRLERKALIGRVPSRKDLDDLNKCEENLRTLWKAIIRYMNDHNGYPPAFLTVDEVFEVGHRMFDSDAGLYPKYISDAHRFACPASEKQDILPGRQLEQTYYYLFEHADLRQWKLLKRKMSEMHLKPDEIIVIQCVAHPSGPRPANASYLAINLVGEIFWMDSNNMKKYSKFFTAYDWAQHAYRSLTSSALAKLGYYAPERTKPLSGEDLDSYRKCERILRPLLVEYGIAEGTVGGQLLTKTTNDRR